MPHVRISVATGVRVEGEPAPEPTTFQLAEDALVADWLVPLVISVLGDCRINCEVGRSPPRVRTAWRVAVLL